ATFDIVADAIDEPGYGVWACRFGCLGERGAECVFDMAEQAVEAAQMADRDHGSASTRSSTGCLILPCSAASPICRCSRQPMLVVHSVSVSDCRHASSSGSRKRAARSGKSIMWLPAA